MKNNLCCSVFICGELLLVFQRSSAFISGERFMLGLRFHFVLKLKSLEHHSRRHPQEEDEGPQEPHEDAHRARFYEDLVPGRVQQIKRALERALGDADDRRGSGARCFFGRRRFSRGRRTFRFPAFGFRFFQHFAVLLLTSVDPHAAARILVEPPDVRCPAVSPI